MKTTTTLLSALTLALAVLLVACEKKPTVNTPPPAPTSTIETAGLTKAIDAYAAHPTDEHAADVDKAFAELDGEIAELSRRVAETTGPEQSEAQTKLGDLKEFRNKEMMRYTEAQAEATTETLKDGAKKVGDSLQDTGEKVGESLKDAGEDVGESLKDAGDAIKDGVEDVVDTVKEKAP